jgi:4-amino-4-deoxy-L-arabinose transferase-like glycosyltransferase
VEVPTKIPASVKKVCSSPGFVVGIAFVFRIVILHLEWRGLDGGPGATTPYGYEAGSIADAIVSGRGFSSPFPSVRTGPTAFLCPLYPYLVAGIFKVWGIFSLRSHIVIQVLNSLFASLVVLPLYAVAKRTLGAGIAVAAAWLWVFLPSAWHIPIADIWDTALTALLFTLIFWATIAIRRQSRLSIWAAYGALWAIGALVNASVLSVLPFFLIWLAWTRFKESSESLVPILMALGTLALGIMPWTVRNYREFGKWIPMRSNFGLELWWGNNPSGDLGNSFVLHPVQNLAEDLKFQRLGEIRYMEEKQQEALEFIASHPVVTFRSTLRRIGDYWFAVSDRPDSGWSSLPASLKVLFLLNGSLVLFGWLGAVLAFRAYRGAAVAYWIVLLVFPLVYYVTHTLIRYRFPMEPILSILGVYGVAVTLAWAGRLRFPHTLAR